MSTISDARLKVRAIIEAATILGSNGQPVNLAWPNEGEQLLADPSVPVIHTDVLSDQAVFVEHGRGLGFNRYRNPGRIASFCFIEKNTGLDEAERLAMQIRDLLSSFDSVELTTEIGTVFSAGEGSILAPTGLVMSGRYHWASTEIPFYFDSIG